uniref:C-type lectin-like n=1 Tax=Monopterus albus TaxID=43700 RepID=UPI0009B3D520|nr:C-type lectin-like [Monopterus albus]
MFISSPLTWADAQSYCRQHYTDLATIESSAENSALYSTIPNGVNVWIGLYRNAWTWSDNSSSVFRNWKSGQPDNSNLNEYCVSEDSQHQWYDDNCQNQYAFICHEDPVVKTTVVRMKMQTSADMTDPVINTQLLHQVKFSLSLFVGFW